MNTEARMTRSRARCTGEQLAKGIQSERKGAKPPQSVIKGPLSSVSRPALMDLSNASNVETQAEDIKTITKEVPAADLVHKDTDAEESGMVPAEATVADQLLQEAARLSLDEQTGTTRVRMPQPTPANTPVGAAAEAQEKALSGPSKGSRLSRMGLEEEMMVTPLSGDERWEVAGKTFMEAAAEAIAQAAAYPKIAAAGGPSILQAGGSAAGAPGKQAATVTSAIVSGDLAAANRAPAPQKAEPEAAEVNDEKLAKVKLVKPEVEKASYDAADARVDRTIAEIQRDLKSAIKMKRAAKVAASSAACESSAYPGISAAEEAGLQDDASLALCNAMGGLGIDPEARKLLRGQPLPSGRHTRFSESGAAMDSPTAERVLLRGVPAPAGAHLRFQATPEK